MNTFRITVCLMLFQCLLFSSGVADVAKLPAEARTTLQGGDFTIVKKVNQIPSAAFAALNEGGAPDDFKMADFGQAFQKTDANTDKSLPLRQLQFAAISKDYVLIHFARAGEGSEGLGYYFVLLKKSEDKFTTIWAGYGPQCSDLQQFRTQLKADKIVDNSDYGP